ncbi:hypothetical protein ACH4U5_14570 [Streptomyces sp. NPDC020858]|uniref:hypothetical protein n=1 Tax=Streptomyces sp. NPDC020858 TaxID=3365097 RepID=UPI00379F297A
MAGTWDEERLIADGFRRVYSVDARYDELTRLLAPHRQPADDALRLVGEVRFDDGARYRADGVDYWFRRHPSR